jgi:uncharacterized protein YkwD
MVLEGRKVKKEKKLTPSLGPNAKHREQSAQQTRDMQAHSQNRSHVRPNCKGGKQQVSGVETPKPVSLLVFLPEEGGCCL